MATLTDSFVAPAWLDPEVTPHGTTSSGRRVITWTLPIVEGRKILGNLAAWAHFTVEETSNYSGEAGRAYGQRVTVWTGGSRDNFTDAASKRIRTDLISAVNRYGFERLWNELHRAAADKVAESHRDQAAQARRAADWWDRQAWLVEMESLGLLVHEPIHRDLNTRETRVSVASAHSPYGRDSAPVIARLFLDGEQVGWVTIDHTVVPDDAILRAPAA